ncbi:hypothetical protein JCM3775_002611 [Rhodotorula graminis]
MPGRHRETSSGSEMCLYVIAFFIPPLAVAMRSGHGVNGCDVLINICLWILGFFPGIIHAFWLVSKSFRYNPSPRVHVVYHQQPQPIVHHGAPAAYGEQAAYGAPAAHGAPGHGAAPPKY